MILNKKLLRPPGSMLILIMVLAFAGHAVSRPDNGIWVIRPEIHAAEKAKPAWVRPMKFTAVELDPLMLQSYLDEVPPEKQGDGEIIELPMPDGVFARFRIARTDLMHPDLAAKFPGIRTFCGQGITDPTASVRLDQTPAGFHAQILSSGEAVYIDPYSRNDPVLHVSYYRGDYTRNISGPHCLFNSEIHGLDGDKGTDKDGPSAHGDILRTYRLAIASTVEYAEFHSAGSPTVVEAMAAITTTVNRVVGIYEQELAVRLQIVPNNDQLVFLNPATDPYSNLDGGAMLTENQTAVDSIIGSTGYDIGHVLSTGGGGVAYFGVCNPSFKAGGVTGSSSPIGDSFDVDFVAHEMGHQFHANHTFNSTTGSCTGNRRFDHAYEPGSGSTIMAYAGICGTDDLQDYSDPYFHHESLREILTFITNNNGTGGDTCSVNTSTGNSIPQVDAGADYTIPANTPFTLTAVSISDNTGPDYTIPANTPFYLTAGKIDGEILAHQAMKKKPAGKSTADHMSYLNRKGLNSKNLGGEDCALYVDSPLSDADKQDLAAKGITVHDTYIPPLPGQHPQGFYLATVGYSSLDEVEADNRIARLGSTEFTHKPLNDVAQQITNADDVHAGTGVPIARDGTGVTIAVADSGYDTNHNDFPATVEEYDMTDGTGIGTWGLDVSNTSSGHGTHVSGSALGRGTNSGGQYDGAAPGASFAFYKIGNDVNAGASETDEIEAITRAGVIGADVFSMSYGGISTHMDGSGGMCQAIDAQVATGMVVCISAGNDANAANHDSFTVAPSTTSAQFNFTVDTAANPSADMEDIRVIWRDDNPGNAAANMTLACSNLGAGESLANAFNGTSARNTDAQRWTLDTNITPGSSKTYNFTLQNNQIGGSMPTVHFYALDTGTWDSPDSSSTVLNPSFADNALCVAAWVHRVNWTDWTGAGLTFGETSGGPASFSSRGPRIDGVPKPDFASPGTAMISTRDDPFMTQSTLRIDDDGSNDSTGPTTHYVQQGTSMACPFAAGVCALLIQEKPLATPSQIRDALVNFASQSGAPDFDVGFGLIDAQASVNNTPSVVDEDPLLYSWEERDLGPPQTLTDSDNGSSPLFRFWHPTLNTTRTFPEIKALINNVPVRGERLPSTIRVMDFRVTVRDNRPDGGGTSYDDMRVTVDGTAGPFRVTSPNTALAVSPGSLEVTWDVAGTDAGSVNTAFVNIQLSVDGGYTWPWTLASSTPNDGAEMITVPSVATDRARIRVEADGNIFFDISNTDFIIATAVDFEVDGPVLVDDIAGNNSGSVDPGEVIDLSLGLRNGGTQEATNISTTLSSLTAGVTVVSGTSAYPSIPAGSGMMNAVPFRIQVAGGFECGQSIMLSLNVISDQVTRDIGFSLPVGAITFRYDSITGTDNPVPINDDGIIDIPFPVSGVQAGIKDVNFRIGGTACNTTPGSVTVGFDHTWVPDIILSLISPQGTQIALLNGVGGSGSVNICQAMFDDEGPYPPIQSQINSPEPPFTGTWLPLEPLFRFDGEDANGIWLLRIQDNFQGDTGSVRAFSLIITPETCNASNAVDVPVWQLFD